MALRLNRPLVCAPGGASADGEAGPVAWVGKGVSQALYPAGLYAYDALHLRVVRPEGVQGFVPVPACKGVGRAAVCHAVPYDDVYHAHGQHAFSHRA